MRDWKKVLLSKRADLRQAMEIIDASALQIALVVDENGRLLGTITDGDIRRALLRNVGLKASVTEVMNADPYVVNENERKEGVLAIMKKRLFHQVPVVDKKRRVVNLYVLDELLSLQGRPNWVVLMAGGLGERLRPLTENCPKPLLRVGGKPILEHIINGFVEHGFNTFFISVNYRGDDIKSYFKDGSKLGVSISYLNERTRLGTAGALSLLPGRPNEPFVVMNGDLLTRVNYQNLCDFHTKRKAIATMCVREYHFQVPFGVVSLDDGEVAGISEKPVQRFFVNAGIYVLDPQVLKLLKKGKHCDMPTLLSHVKQKKRPVAAFPLREYWLDIGRVEDFTRANKEFQEQLKGGAPHNISDTKGSEA